MESQISNYLNNLSKPGYTKDLSEKLKDITSKYGINDIDLSNLNSVSILDDFDCEDIWIIKGFVYQLAGLENKMLDCFSKNKTCGLFYTGLYYDLHDNEKFINYYLNSVDIEYNSNAMCNLADYYRRKGEIENMMRYYQMAIDQGHSSAMNNLANYYRVKDDIDNMMRYYQMAIDHGNSCAMNNLACYYVKQREMDKAIKYYQMAIDKGQCNAIYNLALCYKIQDDIQNMIKYFQMAITKEQSDAMNSLATYYAKSGDIQNTMKYYRMAISFKNDNAMNNLAIFYENQNNTNQAIKYYIMAINCGNSKALNDLIDFCKNKISLFKIDKLVKLFLFLCQKSVNKDDLIHINKNIIKCLRESKKTATNKTLLYYINIDNDIIQNSLPQIFKLLRKIYNKKIDYLEMHFKYNPDGPGFLEAKNDFAKLNTCYINV